MNQRKWEMEVYGITEILHHNRNALPLQLWLFLQITNELSCSAIPFPPTCSVGTTMR